MINQPYTQGVDHPIYPKELKLTSTCFLCSLLENFWTIFLNFLMNCVTWVGIILVFSLPASSTQVGIIVAVFGFFFNIGVTTTQKTKNYFENRKTYDDLKNYVSTMKKTKATIQSYAQTSYQQTTGSGKNRHTKTVVSWRNTTSLTYQEDVDITPDISEILNRRSLMRFDSTLVWHSGNELTKQKWDKLLQNQRDESKKHRGTLHQTDKSTVPGMLGEILVSATGSSCFFTLNIYYFFSIVQLSFIFIILLTLVSSNFRYIIQKIIIVTDSSENPKPATQIPQSNGPTQQQPQIAQQNFQAQLPQQNVPVQQIGHQVQQQQPPNPMIGNPNQNMQNYQQQLDQELQQLNFQDPNAQAPQIGYQQQPMNMFPQQSNLQQPYQQQPNYYQQPGFNQPQPFISQPNAFQQQPFGQPQQMNFQDPNAQFYPQQQQVMQAPYQTQNRVVL